MDKMTRSNTKILPNHMDKKTIYSQIRQHFPGQKLAGKGITLSYLRKLLILINIPAGQHFPTAISDVNVLILNLLDDASLGTVCEVCKSLKETVYGADIILWKTKLDRYLGFDSGPIPDKFIATKFLRSHQRNICFTLPKGFSYRTIYINMAYTSKIFRGDLRFAVNMGYNFLVAGLARKSSQAIINQLLCDKIMNNEIGLCKILLSEIKDLNTGAYVGIFNHPNPTFLSLAISYGNLEICQLLLDRGSTLTQTVVDMLNAPGTKSEIKNLFSARV